jgi:hypothetical protein
VGQRQQRELAERAGGGRDAERNTAPFLRHGAADDRKDDGERSAGEPEADEQSGVDVHQERRVDIRHPGETCGVRKRGAEHYPAGAPAVSGCACERAERPPGEVLDRHRDREHLASPPYSSAIGPRYSPMPARAPNEMHRITQPQMRTTSGFTMREFTGRPATEQAQLQM